MVHTTVNLEIRFVGWLADMEKSTILEAKVSLQVGFLTWLSIVS